MITTVLKAYFYLKYMYEQQISEISTNHTASKMYHNKDHNSDAMDLHDTNGPIGLNTAILFVANAVAWILSISTINEIVVILFTALSVVFLAYRFRIQYIKDVRAGLHVFKRPKPVSKQTTIEELAEILMEAERTGNTDYANKALETYYYLKNEDKLKN